MKEFEEIDAMIFTGDVLYTDFEEVKEYIERWSRAIEEHRRIDREIRAEKVKLIMSEEK